jgi:hypothetical protein
MEVAPAGPVGDDGQMSSGLSDRTRLLLAALLSSGLLVAVVVGVIVSVRYVDDKDSSTSSVGSQVDASMSDELKTRDHVKTAAATFVANVNTYSSDDISAYRRRLDGLLTPDFAKSNELFVKSIVKTMKTTKLKSDGKVLRTAVSEVGSSSATALVIADVHATSVFGERVRHFRWKVDLVPDPAHPDAWLVDDFTSVA